ncbi:MAG: Holliday junction branch migration protein RuvA [Pontibacterium sp.]
MIAQLSGRLIEKMPPSLVVDVHGVGYELEASMNTFYSLPEVGRELVIFTHFVVREDAQLLYGFATKEERVLFRHLIKVNGVGPKLALTILSGMSAPDFVRAVNDQDTAALVRLPGVGKKTAERLIVEMKDRLANFTVASTDDFSLEMQLVEGAASAPAVDYTAEAESALVALGYKPVQATKAISQAEKQLGAGADTESLIRQALKSMLA